MTDAGIRHGVRTGISGLKVRGARDLARRRCAPHVTSQCGRRHRRKLRPETRRRLRRHDRLGLIVVSQAADAARNADSSYIPCRPLESSTGPGSVSGSTARLDNGPHDQRERTGGATIAFWRSLGELLGRTEPRARFLQKRGACVLREERSLRLEDAIDSPGFATTMVDKSGHGRGVTFDR